MSVEKIVQNWKNELAILEKKNKLYREVETKKEEEWKRGVKTVDGMRIEIGGRYFTIIDKEVYSMLLDRFKYHLGIFTKKCGWFCKRSWTKEDMFWKKELAEEELARRLKKQWAFALINSDRYGFSSWNSGFLGKTNYAGDLEDSFRFDNKPNHHDLNRIFDEYHPDKQHIRWAYQAIMIDKL